MKATRIALVVCLLGCSALFAVPISLFSDTDTFAKRAKDIVIAKCVSVPKKSEGFIDGLYPAEVEVIMTLKGDQKTGPLKVATIYSMKEGETYLLSNSGGSAHGTNFLSLAELSVVPVPHGFDLNQLKGKTTKLQLQTVFARHLYDIERRLAPLLQEREMLRRAIKDKNDDQFVSNGNVKIGEIKELQSQKRNSGITLNLGPGPLEWSSSAPGKTGFYYFTDHRSETPDWGFAFTNAKSIDEFDGKPLDVRFYQRFSPSRDEKLGRGPFGNSIWVSKGQVILARSSQSPDTIYILQIHEQAQEVIRVRYAVIKK